MRTPLWLAGLLLIILSAHELQAETATNRPPDGNRWLFVFETSKLMQHRAESSAQMAASMIMSGLKGQMHSGDTLAVWTFNDTLHSGVFPLQLWTPETSKQVAQRVFEFLKNQKYEKNPNLAKIMPELDGVIKDSEFITTILFSDGSSEIKGTPFDAKINASYKEWASQQKKSEMPFITLLRAKQGTITHYVVNTPPFPLDLPPLPEELLRPKPVEPIKIPEAPKPVATLPPLILSGKKKEPIETQTVAQANAQLETNSAIQIPATNSASAIAMSDSNHLSVAATNIPQAKQTTAALNSEASAVNNSAPSSIEANALPLKNSESQNAETVLRQKIIWLGVAVLVGLLLAVGVLLLRRSRRSGSASLITRSLDHDRK
ncbi:MAG: hypothetical protein ACTHLW_10750 [Verrucomicrobiota bacterium]